MTQLITLPPRVDISTVSSLREAWLACTATDRNIVINGSAVEQFCAAGAQLIVALSSQLQSGGGQLRLEQLSPALRADLATLGLHEYLS